MNNFSDIIYLNPNQIQINRENRQRKNLDVTDLLDSIRENGVINPIIIHPTHRASGVGAPASEPKHVVDYFLIAGERRLEACKKLNIQVPCRFYSSLNLLEIQIIEFEENHKRKNLPWRDEVNAIGKIYDLSQTQTPILSRAEVAQSLSIPEIKFNQILHVYNHINEKIITFAENLNQAVSLLHKFKSEKSIELEKNLKQILDTKPIPEYLKPISKQPIALNLGLDPPNTRSGSKDPRPTFQITLTSNPILNLDFVSWIKNYSESKFNFIHCDFPSDSQEEFWVIFNCFMENIKNLVQDQAHIVFWLKMNYYEEVKDSFNSIGFDVLFEPFIWYKSDTKPNQIFGDPPKSTYETALIINHNNRPFKKQIQNAYHTPRASQPICPNQKSIPMLKYFLSTFIDENTNVFDPTCGSGSALIAAEQLGSKSILGLEINQERCQKANEHIRKLREIRNIFSEK